MCASKKKVIFADITDYSYRSDDGNRRDTILRGTSTKAWTPAKAGMLGTAETATAETSGTAGMQATARPEPTGAPENLGTPETSRTPATACRNVSHSMDPATA